MRIWVECADKTTLEASGGAYIEGGFPKWTLFIRYGLGDMKFTSHLVVSHVYGQRVLTHIASCPYARFIVTSQYS